MISDLKYAQNIIHCFDPGDRTGYVKYDRTVGKIVDYTILTNYYQMYLYLQNVDKYTDIVIIESNVGKLSCESQIQMCKYVGFLEGVSQTYDLITELQSPMRRTGFKIMSKKYFEKTFKTYEKHNIDAFAHILAYIYKKEGVNHIL